MWDIIFIVKDLIKTRNLQKWLNNRFKDSRKIIIDKDSFDKIGIKNLWFYTDGPISLIEEVFEEYDLSGLMPTDIVVDIGASIGAFTIFAAKNVNKVYAIEPLFNLELQKNIELNNLNNVEIINSAIGHNNGKFDTIEFYNKTKSVEIMSFANLKLKIQKIDFLKIDCEGCEWSINPIDFEGVRRIEMEIHIRKNSYKFDSASKNRLLEWFKINSYEVKINEWEKGRSHDFIHGAIVHATKINSQFELL
jgi:FkbM family methyltransferase